MKDLTLVIPAKFEKDSLPIVLKELQDLKLKKIVIIPPYDHLTRQAIEKFDCEILDQKGEGFGSALIQGINRVQTKYLCIFNADGSFDPKYLNQMVELLETKYDFVFNSRYVEEGGSDDDTFLTYIGNKFFTLLCKKFIT